MGAVHRAMLQKIKFKFAMSQEAEVEFGVLLTTPEVLYLACLPIAGCQNKLSIGVFEKLIYTGTKTIFGAAFGFPLMLHSANLDNFSQYICGVSRGWDNRSSPLLGDLDT